MEKQSKPIPGGYDRRESGRVQLVVQLPLYQKGKHIQTS